MKKMIVLMMALMIAGVAFADSSEDSVNVSVTIGEYISCTAEATPTVTLQNPGETTTGFWEASFLASFAVVSNTQWSGQGSVTAPSITAGWWVPTGQGVYTNVPAGQYTGQNFQVLGAWVAETAPQTIACEAVLNVSNTP